DPEVDLVAGPGDVAPVKEIVADEGADVRVELVADLNADLGDHREFAVVETTAVAVEGQQSAGHCHWAPVESQGGAAGVEGLGVAAQGQVGAEVDDQVAPVVFGPGTELAAEEDVARVELIDHAHLVPAEQRHAGGDLAGTADLEFLG